ncbi:MAG: glycosyltransferase family 1 protein [Ruminococcaceae bacterium]|nr:glycosyltransferase family 1 protein [Oscillospiraceae bacterium]
MEKILVYGMTDTAGGMESYLMTMYRNIPKDKITFDFVTDWDKMAYQDEVLAGGSIIHHIPKKSDSIIGQITAFSKILKKHKEYKKVYFNIMNAGSFLNMIAPILFGRKIIVHSHSDFHENVRLHKIFKGIMNKFTSVKLACSIGAAEHMFTKRDINKGNYTVVKNAIDVEKFIFDAQKRDEKRKELGIEDKFAVLHVGRIVNAKNPIYLINIFAELLKMKPDAVLLYAGVGNMESDVRAHAEKLGVSSSIMFLGERGDIPELMCAADVFILPSVFEGFGIVALEAQTADLPCVLSDKLPDMVEITDNVRFMSIALPAKKWAEEISKITRTTRKNRYSDITKAGYNIKDETEKLLSIIL